MSLSNMVSAIKAGRTQHAAFVFDGVLDIVSNERILADNGFELTRAYCTEENLTPGNIQLDNIVARFANDDGALTGFNFNRNAALLLGVELDDGLVVDTTTLLCKLALEVYGVRVELRTNSGSDYLALYCYQQGSTTGGTQPYTTLSNSNMVAFREHVSSNPNYHVYFATDRTISGVSGRRLFKHIIISPDGTITLDSSFQNVFLSDYAWARLEYLKSQGICEVWSTRTNSSEVSPNQECSWRQFSVADRNLTQRTIEYSKVTCVKGEQPRSTSGAVVSFTGKTDTSFIDQNADTYANTVWGSSKLLRDILKDVTGNPDAFFYGYVDADGTTAKNPGLLRFLSNPFSGKKGVLYRDLLSWVVGSVGKSAVLSITFAMSSTTSGDKIANLTFDISAKFTASSNLRGSNGSLFRTLTPDEYYAYDKADFVVQPIGKVTWKTTLPESGFFPADISLVKGDGASQYYVVNNPLYNDYGVDPDIYLGYFYDSIKAPYPASSPDLFGNYSPCVIETFLGIHLNVGGNVVYKTTDNVSETMPIFVMTIVWNGFAKYVLESTGKEVFNQYEDPAFRGMIQEDNKTYQIAENTGGSSSYLVKHNINDISNAGNLLDNLRPVSFQYNDDPDGKTHYGLVFEETKPKLPVICKDDQDPKRRKINYVELVPLLLSELQSLRKRVKDLEAARNTGQN